MCSSFIGLKIRPTACQTPCNIFSFARRAILDCGATRSALRPRRWAGIHFQATGKRPLADLAAHGQPIFALGLSYAAASAMLVARSANHPEIGHSYPCTVPSHGRVVHQASVSVCSILVHKRLGS